MIHHSEIGPESFATSRKLKTMIIYREITFAGNRQLKIYGRLSCRSGKRMKHQNRVFFADERDALEHGYRACGHCMREQYLTWKSRS